MKTIKLITLLFLLVSLNVQGQVYNFPIKPGTPEWEKLDTFEEMIEVCKIPDSILQSMTTGDLLETCLNHPFKGNIYLYSTLDKGFQVMANTFEVYKEILKRNDIEDHLLKSAIKIQSRKADIGTGMDSFEPIIDDAIIRFLFKESAIKGKISGDIKDEISAVLEDNSLSKSMLSSAIVYTPKGSIVSDTGPNVEEYNSSLKKSTDNYWKERFPQAYLVNSSTTTYNCHAYAWHITEGGSSVWMGFSTNPTSIYWRDGSYSPINCTEAGLKVSYEPGDNHSAVTTEVNGTFISKWGKGPLMKHRKDYCPYISNTLNYYIKEVPYQSTITGSYAQNAIWNTLNTVTFVRSSVPVTLKVDYPNAYKITWELTSGGPDVAWGPESSNGKIAGITLYSSSNASLRATAHTPCNKITTDFFFNTANRFTVTYDQMGSMINIKFNDIIETAKLKNYTLTIVDINGLAMKKINITGDATIDISNLKNNIYYINLTDGTIEGTYKQAILKN